MNGKSKKGKPLQGTTNTFDLPALVSISEIEGDSVEVIKAGTMVRFYDCVETIRIYDQADGERVIIKERKMSRYIKRPVKTVKIISKGVSHPDRYVFNENEE